MLTRRIVVFSPQDEFLFELSQTEVFSAKEVEEINGEHSLTIVTTRKLEKEQRILTKDATEKWREYVVMGSDGSHDSNQRPFGTYACVWSLQHDFKLFGVDDVIGLDSPVTASIALGRILDNTARWSKGTVTRSANSGADMTQRDGWEAMQLLIANWGGEIDVTITVSNERVSARKVDLYEALGNQNATRRFDYRRDLASMRRKVDETPIACRIRPYGKGERTIDGIDVKITIEEVNDGKDYLQNDAMASQLRLPNGSGEWEYPTLNVTNTSIDDPEELLEWGQSVLEDYTTPKATYESNVMQFVEAGMSAEGVALGDKTQCVDRDFDPNGGVRIEARIRKIENDLLDPALTRLTMGDVAENYMISVGTSLKNMNSNIYDLMYGAQTTADYLNHLLDHINEEINATGGYTYLVPGIGAITYDEAASDPSVGSEASQVTEMRGGTLRFANSRTSSGDWNWTNVITADGYIGLAATIARLTAGSIGSLSGNYWNLDTGEFRMAAASTKVGNQTLAQYIGDNLGLTQTEVFNLLTKNGALQGLYMSGNQLYVNASYINTGALNANLITTGFLNATRIHGGTLKLGGSDNGNGIMQVLNADNVEVCRFDKDGAKIVGDVNMLASCNLFNRASPSMYDRRAETTIGVMHFTNSSLFSWLAGSYVSSDNYNLPGLRITGVNAYNNTTIGYIQIIPPIQGSHKRSSLYSEDPILITSGDASSGLTGVLVEPTRIDINAKQSNHTVGITLKCSDESIEISSPTINIGNNINNYHVSVAGDTVSVGGITTYVGRGSNGATVVVSAPVATFSRIDATMLNVSGTKSRVAETENYGRRLLYCYESPSPLFGDVGSGVIGEDGTCVVSIDDVFAECSRTDMSYQTFLQKCGSGDIWVSEKAPGYFVVEGTPGLLFDWEIKAHQMGYELERLEDKEQRDELNSIGLEDIDLLGLYDEELNYIKEIESLYEEAA